MNLLKNKVEEMLVLNRYIADMHLGHANIIKLSNRPFKNVDEMNKVLIDSYNSVVKDDDDVYIDGDLCYRCDNPLFYIKQLKGRKHLIIGNHDKFLLKNSEVRKCFVEIKDIITVNDNGRKIVICHYPMVEWDGYYRDVVHFYGHIHNNFDNPTSQYIGKIKNAYNIGVDVIGYKPLTYEQIVK